MTNDRDVVAGVPLDPLPLLGQFLLGPQKVTGSTAKLTVIWVYIWDYLLEWHSRQQLGLGAIQHACSATLLVSLEVSMPCSWEPNPKNSMLWLCSGWLEHHSESQVTKFRVTANGTERQYLGSVWFGELNFNSHRIECCGTCMEY
jgi:hypothetical protein